MQLRRTTRGAIRPDAHRHEQEKPNVCHENSLPFQATTTSRRWRWSRQPCTEASHFDHYGFASRYAATISAVTSFA